MNKEMYEQLIMLLRDTVHFQYQLSYGQKRSLKDHLEQALARVETGLQSHRYAAELEAERVNQQVESRQPKG